MKPAASPAVEEVIATANALHQRAAALNLEGKIAEATAAYGMYRAALSAAEAAAAAEVGDSGGFSAVSSRLWAAAAAAPRLCAAPRDVEVLRRARAAVLGAKVADAAAMPLHWVYDLAALGARIASAGGDPAFCLPPADAFYKYTPGRNSPYGEQAEALLTALADGGWSAEGYAARNFEAFGAPAFAAGGGYSDASTRGFVRLATAGARDTAVVDPQANAYARLPPLVAALAGDTALLPAAARMVSVTQSGPEASSCAAAAAQLLEAIVLGATPAAAIESVVGALPADDVGAGALRAALAMAGETHAAAAAKFGRSCHLPGSLSTAVHAVLLGAISDYAAAVRATIAEGGCNASRAGFVGACLAAALGEAAIPAAWKAQTTEYAAAEARIDAVLRGAALNA